MSDDNNKDQYDPDGWENVDDADNPFIQDEVPFYEDSRPQPVKYSKPPKSLFATPKSIFEYLDSKVYGHSEFKRQLALFIWQIKHRHHPAALLVAGNSGEGKTETIRALQKIYHNIAMTDGASITPQGYKGNNKLASSMNLLDLNNPADPPIFVIDEVDKLILRGGAWTDTELTGELLKLMEDGVVDISVNDREQKFISTENISFILLGSFSRLTDRENSKAIGFNASIGNSNPRRKTLTVDMIKDQLTPELIGRIGTIVILEPFEQADFENILRDERYSPVHKFEKEYGVHIHLKPGRRKQIAHDAYTNQTGVRSMSNEISRCLMASLFEDPNIKEITI